MTHICLDHVELSILRSGHVVRLVKIVEWIHRRPFLVIILCSVPLFDSNDFQHFFGPTEHAEVDNDADEDDQGGEDGGAYDQPEIEGADNRGDTLYKIVNRIMKLLTLRPSEA